MLNAYLTLDELGVLTPMLPLDFTDFLTLDVEKQELFLMLATKRLDNRYNFKDVKTDKSQPLEFPRGGSNTVPTDIKLATLIISHTLSNMVFGDGVFTGDGGTNKRERLGRTLELEKFTNLESVELVDLDRYNLLDEFLKPYLGREFYLCRG